LRLESDESEINTSEDKLTATFNGATLPEDPEKQ
jgi:hypothetical protein